MRKRAGFTLLELLIVLFLLSLGYVSLYSSGMGTQATTTDDIQSTISKSRDIVRYARRLAIAKGAPISVAFTASDIKLYNLDGSTVPSPADITQPYSVESTFTLNNSQLLLLSDQTASTLYFNAQGRPISRFNSASDMQPFKFPIALELSGYNNGNDDGSYSTSDEAFLLISNVTGELIAL